jgi:hypothetical protein
MKKRFSEEQIIGFLREAKTGVRVQFLAVLAEKKSTLTPVLTSARCLSTKPSTGSSRIGGALGTGWHSAVHKERWPPTDGLEIAVSILGAGSFRPEADVKK